MTREVIYVYWPFNYDKHPDADLVYEDDIIEWLSRNNIEYEWELCENENCLGFLHEEDVVAFKLKFRV